MQPDTVKTTLASLAMRLRRVTSLPPAACKELLAALPEDARLRYVEHYERSGLHFLINPLELDLTAAKLITEVRREAEDLYERGEFGKRMGSGGKMHHWMQQELARRHDIQWRTPWQMNPGVAFD